jgi:hypothetical protein
MFSVYRKASLRAASFVLASLTVACTALLLTRVVMADNCPFLIYACTYRDQDQPPCCDTNGCAGIDGISLYQDATCGITGAGCVGGTAMKFTATNAQMGWSYCYQEPGALNNCGEGCVSCATITYYTDANCSAIDECGSGQAQYCGVNDGVDCNS